MQPKRKKLAAILVAVAFIFINLAIIIALLCNT